MRKTILAVIILMLLVPMASFAQEMNDLFMNSIAKLNGYHWNELNSEEQSLLATGVFYGMYWANIVLLGYDADNFNMMTLEQMGRAIATVTAYYSVPANLGTTLFMALSTAYIQSWN